MKTANPSFRGGTPQRKPKKPSGMTALGKAAAISVAKAAPKKPTKKPATKQGKRLY